MSRFGKDADLEAAQLEANDARRQLAEAVRERDELFRAAADERKRKDDEAAREKADPWIPAQCLCGSRALAVIGVIVKASTNSKTTKVDETGRLFLCLKCKRHLCVNPNDIWEYEPPLAPRPAGRPPPNPADPVDPKAPPPQFAGVNRPW